MFVQMMYDAMDLSWLHPAIAAGVIFAASTLALYLVLADIPKGK